MAPSAERGSGMNEQAGGDSAPHIRISSTDEIATALDRAGLRRGRMVVVVVGGAGAWPRRTSRRGRGAAERGHAHRRTAGRRRDRRGHGFGCHALDRPGTRPVGGSIPARRRRGRRNGRRSGWRECFSRRGRVGAEPHPVPHRARITMGRRGHRGSRTSPLQSRATGLRSPCWSTAARSPTPTSREASTAVGRSWCSPEAAVPPTPSPEHGLGTAAKPSPSTSRRRH